MSFELQAQLAQQTARVSAGTNLNGGRSRESPGGKLNQGASTAGMGAEVLNCQTAVLPREGGGGRAAKARH